MTDYKLLLLDADNTLFDFGAAELYALETTFRDFGWDYNKDVYSFYHHCNDTLWKALERGEVTRSALKVLRFEQTRAWMLQNGYAAPECDYDAMCVRYLVHLGESAVLFEGADALCEELKKQYRLALITNGTASVQYSRMKASGMERHFEKLFISEEIGAEKPSLHFFERVFAAYPEIKREEMLVIGDSVSSDIKGAYNAGIDACLIFTEKCPENIPVKYHGKSFDELKNILL